MSRWTESWTLGFHASGAKAITGPALYGTQTVEVVPKLEAEQCAERLEAKAANSLAAAEQANRNEMRVEQANTALRRELQTLRTDIAHVRGHLEGYSSIVATLGEHPDAINYHGLVEGLDQDAATLAAILNPPETEDA